MTDPILIEDHGKWVEILLNRPDRLNSFNADMHLALRAALNNAAETSKRALLLTGVGRGFLFRSRPRGPGPAQDENPT